ncbi:MAG: formylglycine-generating enzyme family protein [Verrucomicrobia bacterium]|nr:formylglycine-generating enzyme family protein [Verrucomicrobiota bacterium]
MKRDISGRKRPPELHPAVAGRSHTLLLAALSVVFTVTTVGQTSAPPKLTNSLGMELLRVRSGAFLYGAPEKTTRPNLWHPRFQVKVTFTNDFYLGAVEVTQAQFKKMMGDNPSQFRRNDLPVESVTYAEAIAFCQKLSELPQEKTTGRVYDLPTSAEWEYACRAGSADVFPWGNEDETKLGEYAWCRDRYGATATQTHPVGTKRANPWGFHDMLGNVWEWCADGAWEGSFQFGAYSAKADGWINPNMPGEKSHSIVIRGGGWNSDFRAANCWLVYRQRPLCRDNHTGFRIKCVIKETNHD